MDSRLTLDSLKPPADVGELYQRAQRAENDRRRERVFLKDVSVGTSSTPIAHGQNRIPKGFVAIPHSGVVPYRAAEPDEGHVYIRAASAITCDVEIIF